MDKKRLMRAALDVRLEDYRQVLMASVSRDPVTLDDVARFQRNIDEIIDTLKGLDPSRMGAMLFMVISRPKPGSEKFAGTFSCAGSPRSVNIALKFTEACVDLESFKRDMCPCPGCKGKIYEDFVVEIQEEMAVSSGQRKTDA